VLVGVKLVVKIVFRKVKQVNLVIILKRAAKITNMMNVVIVVNEDLMIVKVIFVVVEIVVVDENGINQDMMDTKMIPCPWMNTTIQEDVVQEKV
jgi:hypothetical protein